MDFARFKEKNQDVLLLSKRICWCHRSSRKDAQKFGLISLPETVEQSSSDQSDKEAN